MSDYDHKEIVHYLRYKRNDDHEMNHNMSAMKAWLYLFGWRKDIPRKDYRSIMQDAGYTRKQISNGMEEATAPRVRNIRRKARTGPGLGEIIPAGPTTTA